MKRIAERRPWGLVLDQDYEPKVSMIIPTYNEASVIVKKLQNIEKLDYPKEKLEVIIVDSASRDTTVDMAKKYVKKNGFPFKILILEEEERRGKGKALNFALQYSKGEVIATSDADSYWEASALRKALRYMAYPQIGAVTGREILINLNRNDYTTAEGLYRKFYNTLRIGESKYYSTLIFQGEFAVYKREVFEKFEDEKGSDDTGTVINIISKGLRCIFVPNAVFHDMAPSTWKGRMTVKTRRAQHLIYALTKAVKLKIKRRIPMSSLIIFVNFFLHVINPLLSIALLGSLIYLLYEFPLFLVCIPLLFLSRKLRAFLLSYISNNIALVLAIFRCIKGDRQDIWQKVPEMRY